MIGNPNEQMLPTPVRESLRDLMKLTMDIEVPAVALCRHVDNSASDLIFNLFREDFETEERHKWAMYAIEKFLPRHLRVRTVFSNRGFVGTDQWTPL